MGPFSHLFTHAYGFTNSTSPNLTLHICDFLPLGYLLKWTVLGPQIAARPDSRPSLLFRSFNSACMIIGTLCFGYHGFGSIEMIRSWKPSVCLVSPTQFPSHLFHSLYTVVIIILRARSDPSPWSVQLGPAVRLQTCADAVSLAAHTSCADIPKVFCRWSGHPSVSPGPQICYS